MTDRTPSSLTMAIVAVSTQWLSSFALAQDYPPAPPLPIRFTQLAQAPEPTLIGPVLPGLIAADPVAPHPDDLPPADASTAVPDADVEAFARGPVHQAFADVYDINPVTNEVIAKAPPDAVDELPPEQAPTGENVQWISGYWNWDIEATDFIWVSGVWRDVPPGRRWVPGYWAEVTGGFQWVGGFWADAQVQELTYVPAPPPSLEVGPNVPPPGDDQHWVPGNWTYVSDDYRWTPGYYAPCQPDYMWVPNQYCYTPNGCVFVPGYLDYRFARRGTLFSPVRFRHPLDGYGFGRPACYRPQYSVNMAGFMIHLFVRPQCRSFYYGDYYGNQYAGLGFSPWYRRSFGNRGFHDPCLSFYRWDSHRRGIDFDRSVGNWHERYETNSLIRPPRMIRDQDQFLAEHRGDRSAELAVMGHRFDDVTRGHNTGVAFHKVNQQDLDVMRETRQINRTLESARRQTELNERRVPAGDRDPGQAVDLSPQSIRDRVAAGRPPRGDAGPAPDSKKLNLGDLPANLKERTRESVAHADRIQARRLTPADPVIGRALDTSGNGGASRIEERRNGREAGDTTLPGIAPTPEAAARRNARSVEGRSSIDLKNGTADDSTPRQRGTEIRPQIEERRTTNPVDRLNPRVAPTPDAVESRPPREVDRSPRVDSNRIDNAPVVRERQVPRVQNDPAPVIRRQEAEQRAPRVDRIPVDRTPPRQIERQAPVERQMPIQRQAPVERQVPVQREQRAPVQREQRAPVQQEQRAPVQREQRAPVQREQRAPVQREQRAPAAERAPSGQQQAPRQRRGKD